MITNFNSEHPLNLVFSISSIIMFFVIIYIIIKIVKISKKIKKDKSLTKYELTKNENNLRKRSIYLLILLMFLIFWVMSMILQGMSWESF